MGELEKTLEILDQQYEDYCAMYQVSLEQQACIEREDLSELNVSFERVHRLMDQIRLRQADMPELSRNNSAVHPEFRKRGQTLRRIIGELEELRQVNEKLVKELLQRTRGELRQFDKGQRAIRGYQSTKVQDARFFDGTR